MFLGQLLRDNLCYGTSSLVCVAWRAPEQSPCNGASHIGLLPLKLLLFTFFSAGVDWCPKRVAPSS